MRSKRTSSKKLRGIRSMTRRAIERAALTDPDARPLTAADLKRMRRTPRIKVIRRALGLTQEEFAARYRIPLGTLRDWEEGRATPDQPTQAYLTVIARSPEGVEQALKGQFSARTTAGMEQLWPKIRVELESASFASPLPTSAFLQLRKSR